MNSLPRNNDDLFVQVEQMKDGLARHSAALGNSMVTEAMLRQSVVAAETAIRLYDESMAAKTQAYAVHAEADATGQEFLRAARYLLAIRFGERYSPDWAATGFPNNSTMIPKTLGGRQTLLCALQNYFANHPTMEAPAIGVIAAQAGVHFHAVSDARRAINVAQEEQAICKAARDAAIADMRKQMRGCIDELTYRLSDDDARWYAFGLTPPAAPETPEVVDGLELTQIAPGNVVASWNGAPRAGRYRVLKQIVGVDAEMVAMATVYDPQFMFTELTAGQTLRVQIEAANEAGVAGPSEVMEIMIV